MARILIIDDEPHVLETLRLAFEGQGHEAILEGESSQAVATARDERPDLIILDLMMPGMDGYQLFHHLSDEENLLGTPIVIITARHGKIYELISLKIGAKLHITKPFNPLEVVEKMENLLEDSYRQLFINLPRLLL